VSTRYKSANYVIKDEDEEIEINRLREALNQPSYREIIFAGLKFLSNEKGVICNLRQ